MDMGTTAPIVVGVDASEKAAEAVRWAAKEAAHRDAPLLIVHAMGIPDLYMGAVPPTDSVREALRERGEQILSDAKGAAEATAAVAVEVRLDSDTPVAALRSRSRGARLLVLGASGHGGFLAGAVLGSTAVQLAAHAPCPVVIIRGDEADRRPETDPVVVGVDGSALSDEALGWAYEEASLRGAPLVAVHAWSDSDTESVFAEARAYFEWEPLADSEARVLAERIAGWGEKYPDVAVEQVVVRDKPRHALLERSGRAQLVVVGSRGRGGFRGLLLGSVSQAMIHHADCPVLVVRPHADEREERS